MVGRKHARGFVGLSVSVTGLLGWLVDYGVLVAWAENQKQKQKKKGKKAGYHYLYGPFYFLIGV